MRVVDTKFCEHTKIKLLMRVYLLNLDTSIKSYVVIHRGYYYESRITTLP